MKSPVSKELQVAMFFSSSGDKDSSPFGYVLAFLQASQGIANYEHAITALLKEFDSAVLNSGPFIHVQPPKSFYLPYSHLPTPLLPKSLVKAKSVPFKS